MANNKSLSAAAKAKKDEFYTLLEDIEKELEHYKEHFKGKIVLCNCDDPFESNFFKYFILNFNRFGLKQLMSTSYVPNNGELSPVLKRPYKAVVTSVVGLNNNNDIKKEDIINIVNQKGNELTQLDGNGDFRSAECLSLLDKADIICTNPPFSLFRDYISTIIEHKKKFIIIGNLNAITYKHFFPLLKDGSVTLGYRSLSDRMWFKSDYEDRAWKIINGVRCVGTFSTWFTNLGTSQKCCEKLNLTKRYIPELYPKYDNYDAIEVHRVLDIPYDYDGEMGVPITFMGKYDPKEFEIVGISGELAGSVTLASGNIYKKPGRFYIDGRRLYDRIVIRNKHSKHTILQEEKRRSIDDDRQYGNYCC